MIVLDEHLPSRALAEGIGRWYRGRVCRLPELRLGTIIKDEAVPNLLRTVRQATFVTSNWEDFWQQIEPDAAFCIVCFTLPSKQADDISPLLRRLLRLPLFKTKAVRMGKVARISGGQVAFYQRHDNQLYVQPLP